jgi:murein DD-endopeptidase MepM/ murein hydrolase activator NlpD
MRHAVVIGLLALVACTPVVDAAQFPVSSVPNWGAMTKAAQWDRTYDEMTAKDFVPVPAYNPKEFTVPTMDLRKDRTPENVRILTAKLFYSTRYCAKKHLDAAEYSDPKREHCALDLKLAKGTPVYALDDGLATVDLDDPLYGNNVTITFKNRGKMYHARYAHLQDVALSKDMMHVVSGSLLGTVGSTGKSTVPHLHLDITDSKGKPVHPMRFFPALRP